MTHPHCRSHQRVLSDPIAELCSLTDLLVRSPSNLSLLACRPENRRIATYNKISRELYANSHSLCLIRLLVMPNTFHTISALHLSIDLPADIISTDKLSKVKGPSNIIMVPSFTKNVNEKRLARPAPLRVP